MSDPNKPVLFCSFCGKAQYEVAKLIAGPTCFICDECIVLAHEIVLSEQAIKLYKESLVEQGMVLVHKSVLEKIQSPPLVIPPLVIPPPTTSLERFEAFHRSNFK